MCEHSYIRDYSMKTVFLAIFQGVEAKNILRTSVLPELLNDPDIRLVFFARTPERAEYYRKEFSDSRIVYEAADWKPQGRLERFFALLKFQLIRTATTDLRRRMELDLRGNYLKYAFGRALNVLIARPNARRVARWLDRHLVREPGFAPFFERYRPDVVLLAHLFDDPEIALLREAKRRGVPTIGFVNSWDKLTARAAIRILPDELLVYNDIVRAEAIRHADMPAERIHVVGIPQYDLYYGYRPTPRRDFLRALGIAPEKRLILYAPMGETFSSADWDIIDLLKGWLEHGALGSDIELFIRFQPNDFVDEVELSRRPWLKYDRPGIRFSRTRGVDWDMSGEELERLADTLAHISLLVCYASSISVDAAIFGKPVINIDFEIKPPAELMRSPTQFYRMEHYQKALASGGIRLVDSPQALAEWIRTYLARPETDRAGRRRLVAEQCGPADGKAGERIAGEVRAAGRRPAEPVAAGWRPTVLAALVAFSSLLVGALYVAPPLLIAGHLRSEGAPYVLSLENSRNDLAYLTWAREIYDGRFPPEDPFSDTSPPIIQNPVPSAILAGFLALAGGKVVPAYLLALFVFSQINFLMFYWLGRRLTGSALLAICFALVAVLTPISLRILNFDGTA